MTTDNIKKVRAGHCGFSGYPKDDWDFWYRKNRVRISDSKILLIKEQTGNAHFMNFGTKNVFVAPNAVAALPNL